MGMGMECVQVCLYVSMYMDVHVYVNVQGSGVGLPGILLGRYADTCILSDYMEELVR